MRIGIDLGGTKTEVIALSEQGEQLFRHRLPTPRDDYHQTIETIARLVDMAEQATGQSGTVGMGDRKSTRLNSSHVRTSRMPSSA